MTNKQKKPSLAKVKKAAQASSSAPSPKQLAQITEREIKEDIDKGYSSFLKYDFETAVQYYQQALKKCESSKKLEEEKIRILVRLAGVFEKLSDWKTVLTTIEQIEHSSNPKYVQQNWKILYLKSKSYYQLEDFKAALVVLQTANNNKNFGHLQRRIELKMSGESFQAVPNEIMVYMFSFLDPHFLMTTLALVCWDLYEIADSNQMWKMQYFNAQAKKNRLAKSVLVTGELNPEEEGNSTAPLKTPYLHYKTLFMHQLKKATKIRIFYGYFAKPVYVSISGISQRSILTSQVLELIPELKHVYELSSNSKLIFCDYRSAATEEELIATRGDMIANGGSMFVTVKTDLKNIALCLHCNKHFDDSIEDKEERRTCHCHKRHDFQYWKILQATDKELEELKVPCCNHLYSEPCALQRHSKV